MGNNRNEQQRRGGGGGGGGRGGGGGSGNRPWRLCLIRTYKDRAGEERTHFIPIGSVFDNDGKNFTSDDQGIYVDLRRGDRIASFPPEDD